MAKSSYGCLFVIWSIDESKQMSKTRWVVGEIWGSEKVMWLHKIAELGETVKSYFEMDKWSKGGWEKFNDLR